MSAPDDYAKILLKTEKNGNQYAELAWAQDLGNGFYRLDSTPIWMDGVAWGDIVKAEYNADDDAIEFKSVDGKSGYGLIRIILKDPDKEFGEVKKHLRKLDRLGCDYEEGHPNYLCINIPPVVDFDGVVSYMEESGLNWECAAPQPEELPRAAAR